MKFRVYGFLSLAVLMLALLVGLPVVYAQSLGRIEGHITNLTTGGPPAEPLPSVEILVNDWMVLRSGRDGEWNITGLKPGVYSVRLNLPPGYSPAQDVITTTIWGGNTEVVDLNFYEGDVPLPSVATTSVVTDNRVTPLGQPATATPPVSTAVSTVITSTPATTGTTALPGRAGQGSNSLTTILLWIWAGVSVAHVAVIGLRWWLFKRRQVL